RCTLCTPLPPSPVKARYGWLVSDPDRDVGPCCVVHFARAIQPASTRDSEACFMSRKYLRVIACIVALLVSTTLSAQFVVHDPLNYAQALARYAQLIEQFNFMVKHARRLPVDMASRYRVPATRWRHHDVEVQYSYARPLLTALNFGDTSGALLQEVSERLDDLDEVLPAVPSELRRRLANAYATIQTADSVARMAVHQVGSIRSNGKNTLLAAENMETDAAVSEDPFN